MRHRHELPDPHWERIARFFPPAGHRRTRGRPREDHHRILNGILWRLHTGAPWRDIPEAYGPWQTIYGRFRRWRRDGTWARILTSLLDELEQRGRLGHDLWLVETEVRFSVLRAPLRGLAVGGRNSPCDPLSLYCLLWSSPKCWGGNGRRWVQDFAA
jgi:transposase